MNSEKKIRAGSAILIIHENTILLGKRNKEPNFGRWILPGGGIEIGETHQQAAQREAQEELGIDIIVHGLAGKGVYHIFDEKYHRIIIYSFATPQNLNLSVSSDVSEAKFFTKEELYSLDITPTVKEVLKDANWYE